MLKLLIEHLQVFQQRSFKGSLKSVFLLLYFIYIDTIHAKAWLAGNSWRRQQHCTNGGSRASLEIFLKGFIKDFNPLIQTNCFSTKTNSTSEEQGS